MLSKIFVNLPVKDLARSRAFFQGMGFSFNAQFSDDTAACMVVSESIYAMLLTHPKIRQFTPKPIVDAHASTEVLVALSADSRQEVQALVDRALEQGGREFRPAQDYGFMFGRAFEDLDGHIWEIVWMDPAHVQG